MRPFIISALAASLIGCTWVAPQQAQQASLMGYGAAGALQMDSKTVAKTKTGKKEGRRHRMKAITHTKNAKSNTVPNVSSYVHASGADTGDRPFLYLVQENEAYIGGYNMAKSPYHNLCRQ